MGSTLDAPTVTHSHMLEFIFVAVVIASICAAVIRNPWGACAASIAIYVVGVSAAFSSHIGGGDAFVENLLLLAAVSLLPSLLSPHAMAFVRRADALNDHQP